MYKNMLTFSNDPDNTLKRADSTLDEPRITRPPRVIDQPISKVEEREPITENLNEPSSRQTYSTLRFEFDSVPEYLMEFEIASVSAKLRPSHPSEELSEVKAILNVDDPPVQCPVGECVGIPVGRGVGFCVGCEIG